MVVLKKKYVQHVNVVLIHPAAAGIFLDKNILVTMIICTTLYINHSIDVEIFQQLKLPRSRLWTNADRPTSSAFSRAMPLACLKKSCQMAKIVLARKAHSASIKALFPQETRKVF